MIVSTPQEIALIDARRAAAMLEKLGTPVLGVLRIELTSVRRVVTGYWCRESGRALLAVTCTTTRSMFASWLAGTGPLAQS